MPLIRSISGLRGTLPRSLTSEVISDYCEAFCKFSPEGDIVVANDSRKSGKWIEEIVYAILTSRGRNIIALGIAPTPTVQLIVEKHRASGGIVITASHNPPEWNGLKFINSRGIFLDRIENEALWRVLDNKSFIEQNFSNEGEIKEYKSGILDHINSIINTGIFQKSNIIEKIKGRNFKVVVDAVNASGSKYIPALLREMNCEVIELFCANDGRFPHIPEPLPSHLNDLSINVRIHSADLGIAVDPDADRLVLIDGSGEPIGEELTIVLSIDATFKLTQKYFPKSKLIAVINHSTTALTSEIAGKYNGIVLCSPVGEINVVKQMIESNAIIGGEGSGGVILPQCHLGRDSLVGTALVLALMAEEEKSLQQIVEAYPKYVMIKQKQAFKGEFSELINKLISEFSDYEFNIEDGFKAYNQSGWIQIRSSNTEPIIRVIAESKDKNIAENMLYRVNNVIEKL